MKHPLTGHLGINLLIGLGLGHLAICVAFANCGMQTTVKKPERGPGVMKEFANVPLRSMPDDPGKASVSQAGLEPESEWNSLGLWKQILSSPPTYVPKGFSKRVPEEGLEGRWFVDPRDGKRLYAPATPHLGYSSRTWESEARKITAN